MNKKMRELLAKIESKQKLAQGYMEGENKDIAKAKEILEEVKRLNEEFEVEKEIFENDKKVNKLSEEDIEEVENKLANKQEDEEDKKDTTKEVAKAVRGFISGKGLTEGVGADGGYTVPEDVSTKIEQYKDVDYSLLEDIDVVEVKTNKGARTYQKKGEVGTFVDIDENGEIKNEIEAPKFERLPYAIQDRAGFMPVSNDLVEDSDANILTVVTSWLGKANIATTNKKVLEEIAKKEQTDLKDIDGIKKALNVTLGQAYKNGAKIYTNDDGLNYLDTLKDTNNRPLLNPNPTEPTEMQLRCGTTVLPIKVLPNKVFKSTEGKIPFVIGNLYDYVRKYDRKSMTIMASNVATIGKFNAFANNMTLLRAIVRDDYRIKDADSIVNGYITVNSTTDTSGEDNTKTDDTTDNETEGQV